MTTSQTPRTPSDPYITTGQAAKLLGVHLRSVVNYIERGEIDSASTPGGHRRIRTSDVLALAAKLGIKTTDSAPSLQAEIDALRAEVELLRTERLAMIDQLVDLGGEVRQTELDEISRLRMDAAKATGAGS
jgi:excisionase family DNA binding protein